MISDTPNQNLGMGALKDSHLYRDYCPENCDNILQQLRVLLIKRLLKKVNLLNFNAFSFRREHFELSLVGILDSPPSSRCNWLLRDSPTLL